MSEQTLSRRRGATLTMVSAGVLVLGAIVYAWLAPAATSTQDQLREVTTTIRCPVCIGESIADSTAPISLAMREEAQIQLAEGATAQEVRSFFADTYGPDVLLMPELSGSGAVVWAVPLLIGGGVLVLLVLGGWLWWRRSAQQMARVRVPTLVAAGSLVLVAAIAFALVPDRASGGNAGETGEHRAALAALEAAVESQPGDADIRLAYGTALKITGQDDKAHAEFAAAYRLKPLDADIAYLHAAALLAAGDRHQAAVTLDDLLVHSPQHPPALLMRGVMMSQAGQSEAEDLLTRFLEVSPEDPAANAVRDMLRADS